MTLQKLLLSVKIACLERALFSSAATCIRHLLYNSEDSQVYTATNSTAVRVFYFLGGNRRNMAWVYL